MDNNDPKIQPHTPVSIMAVFANAFNIEKDQATFWLKGIYLDRKRNSYNGFYFDRLKDELRGQIITLKLPQRIKQQVKDGDLYLFKGRLDKDVRRDGVIEPVFIAAEMEKLASDHRLAGPDRRALLRQQKTTTGFQDLGAALIQLLSRNKKPHIALICGKTSVVLQDLYSALEDFADCYRFTEYRTNLLDRQAIITALEKCNNKFDLIAIIRGGGPGLEIFDDVAIAEASLSLQPIVVTAIGHAQDDTLLQQLADQQFTTPTALGTYLREMVSSVRYPASAPDLISQQQNQPKPVLASLMHPLVFIIFAFTLLVLGILLGINLW